MLPAVGIIPVRFASTRFPGKALADLGGKPMIQHVCERARGARALARLLVATDDARIRRVVEGFGVEVRMTSPCHRSGTERVAEAAKQLDEPIVVVIQGDEPLIDPRGIDAAVSALSSDSSLAACTLSERMSDPSEIFDPNVVKVVLDARGNALYFSRSPIPYLRGDGPLQADFRGALARRGDDAPRFLKHVGLYAFRRDRLLEFVSLPPCEAEIAEGLEQLRWLHAGARVRTLIAEGRSIGVDTPADLERVRRLLAAHSREGA
ncbi:MAG: 3-deoxy-manno-octulosonate cytidylyltransferase [Acidobacteriota bacterium]